MSSSDESVRIGTRGSPLALWQAEAVATLLRDRYPATAVGLHIIRPEGDIDKRSSLMKIGGRGVFASALQSALLDRQIDLAVHSTKDVPTISPKGLMLAAFPQREDARDAVVSRHGVGLADLPSSPVIGTSSRRRAVQILALRPDASIADIRGNIDTRLRKSETDAYDAVLLASAGLTRMGWAGRIVEHLSLDQCVPAPGQGALAIESRADAGVCLEMARSLNDPAVGLAVEVERAFLRSMGGGCTTPVGTHAIVDGDVVHMWAMMAAEDGSRLTRVQESLSAGSALDEASSLAQSMMRDLAQRWTGSDVAAGSEAGRPLAHRLVLVTGTDEFSARLGSTFSDSGATAMESPTVQIQPTATPEVLEAALADAADGAFDWIVVTSKQTVPALQAFGAGRLAGRARIAVVGRVTAAAMAEIGLPPDLIPEEQSGPGLAAELVPRVTGGSNVLCLLGSRAGDAITSALRRNEVNAIRVESYRSISRIERVDDMREAVRAGRVDAVVFASPSSVEVVVGQLGADLAALSGACLVAMGRTTADAMTKAGLPVHVTPETPSPDAIVADCEAYFSGRYGVDGA